MGRHSRPSNTIRNTAIATAALATGLGTILTFPAPAGADPDDGCTKGSRNPDVRVCQDHPYYDGGSDSLHALIRLDPLLCVHARVPDTRRLVGTRDCSHPAGPQRPAHPGAADPCACVPGSPAAPPASPALGGQLITAPVAGNTLPEAPAPTTIGNNTVSGPVPIVTH